jgi:hypothetical protein
VSGTALIFSLFLAAAPERILLVPASEAISGRVKAELEALGFEVALSPMTQDDRPALEAAAREYQALAVLRIAKAGIEVWVMDRLTSSTVLRERVTERDEGLLAVRAVEVLRASLLEVAAPTFVSREPPLPPAVAPPPTLPTASLELGPAIALSPGGVPVTAQAALAFRWYPMPRFDLAVMVLAPTVPATVRSTEGSTTAFLSAVGLQGDFLIAERTATFNARVGAGVGLLWSHLEGSAVSPFEGRVENVWLPLPFLRAGASRALGSTVRLWLDVGVAITPSRLVIHFAGREVANFGRPMVFSTLALEVALF